MRHFDDFRVACQLQTLAEYCYLWGKVYCMRKPATCFLISKPLTMKLFNKVNAQVLKQRLKEESRSRTTLSFYTYHSIGNPQLFRDHLFIHFDALEVLGRIYVAKEGINAQISVPDDKMDAFKAFLEEISFLKGIRLNKAVEDNGKSFFKLKILVRERIVADGLNVPIFEVSSMGKHLDAEAFNELIGQENTVLIDMRNHYESEVGHFEGSVCPEVETFRESLPIIAHQFEQYKDKNIVMYCTGGIRCEKASAYMKYQGFSHVFQLNGGIIEYARQVKEKGLVNKFRGKNFVFDERLGERINEEVIAKCHQCGSSCDTHKNCANDACHLLFIQCESCAEQYSHCCSSKCKDFNDLSEEKKAEKGRFEIFNGTKFGKGRYKAHNKNFSLEEI
jgi:UPF0176 protein